MPAGKSTYGSFNYLSEENQRVIRKILDPATETVSTGGLSPADQLTLGKLRGLYASCMNEGVLNELGEAPLVNFVRIVRDLYRGKSTEIKSSDDQRPMILDATQNGLTAALAFLNSRGKRNPSSQRKSTSHTFVYRYWSFL